MRGRLHRSWALAGALAFLLGAACEGAERGPTIYWWQLRPHDDRGPCTQCHTKVDGNRNPVPTITSAARMPHADRGVCSNCHPITTMGSRMGQAGRSAPAPAAARTEWLGLELVPALPVTGVATPAAAGGLVVREADGRAERAGVRTGDVITAVNGVPVTTVADLQKATLGRSQRAGQVDIRRGGQTFTVAIGDAAQPGALPAQFSLTPAPVKQSGPAQF